MRPLGPNARAILALFDEQLGGLAAPSSAVSLILSARNVEIREKNLLVTLDRLAKHGELSKILRPKGGTVYTRPRNLETLPGFRAKLESLATTSIRRGRSTTDRRYELRKQRALNVLASAAIEAGAHDFRYNFKTSQWHSCRSCGRNKEGLFGPCKLRIAAAEVSSQLKHVAGVRATDSGSASRAKSGSRACRRGT